MGMAASCADFIMGVRVFMIVGVMIVVVVVIMCLVGVMVMVMMRVGMVIMVMMGVSMASVGMLNLYLSGLKDFGPQKPSAEGGDCRE